MRMLTVLGATGGFPEPGQACSGFLIECDGLRVVLDLGYATLPRLLAHLPDLNLDAVVITHEHPDHCVDRLPLYCPAGVLDRLQGLEPAADLREVFDVHRLPGSFQLGPFALS